MSASFFGRLTMNMTPAIIALNVSSSASLTSVLSSPTKIQDSGLVLWTFHAYEVR